MKRLLDKMSVQEIEEILELKRLEAKSAPLLRKRKELLKALAKIDRKIARILGPGLKLPQPAPAPVSEEEPKVRRGRPPKARGGVPPPSGPAEDAEEKPKARRGRPPKPKVEAEAEAEEKPKARRGRPPKQKPPAAVEEPFETPKPEPPVEDLAPKKGRRQLSPEARARIVAAQKARWAKKKGTGTGAEGNEESAPAEKMSAVETAELPVEAPAADTAGSEPPVGAAEAKPPGKKRGRKPKALKVVTDAAPPPEPEAPSESEGDPPVSG